MKKNRLVISIGNDHGGVEAKKEVVKHLRSQGIEVIDRGTNTGESCDYPLFAQAVSKDVQKGDASFGILICNTGEGMAMAANKMKGIRAGIVYNEDTARLVREHNHANIIAFGAKFFTGAQMSRFVDLFLESEELPDRHQRRVDEIMKEEG